jgi:hypothetical protein
MKNLILPKKSIVIAVTALSLSAVLPMHAFAIPLINDVHITGAVDFQTNTADTAVLATMTAPSGGQVTNFNVQSNYIDITLDNASNVTFNIAALKGFFRVTPLGGLTNYTISPSCPTTNVTLTGTGAQMVVRLEVFTTNNCPTGGGGGGNGGGYVIQSTTSEAPTVSNASQ